MGTTKQIQKQQTKVVTKTEITQQQSLEIVQTLLHGAISSVAYLRDLFPEKAFQQQWLQNSDSLSYADYANGKLKKKKKNTQGGTTKIQAMQRGKSKRVDMLLNWLETGAFPALSRGRLRAVQLSVHASPDSREKVVEIYIFTVKYDANGQGGKQLAGVQMDSQDGGTRTVEATTAGLQVLLGQLMSSCEALPDLPATRFLSMELFYDGEDLDSPDWVPSTTTDLMFASAEGWSKNSTTLSELPFAFHGATLKITHLDYMDHAAPGPLQPQHVQRIPSQLEYNDVSSRFQDLDIGGDNDDGANNDVTPSTVVDEEMGLTDPSAGLVKQLQSPARTSQQIANRGRSQRSHEVPSTHDHGRRRTFNDTLDTQSSNVPRMKSALDDMQQPERLTQGDTQTQAPLRAPRQVSDSLVTAGPSMLLTRKAQDSSAPATIKLKLLPEVATRLRAEKTTLYKKATQLAAPKQKRVDGREVVLCQCGFDGEDADMINCSFCDTWQHFNCYGFTGSSDPRVTNAKDVHACYQCLFGGRDAVTLARLQDLALKRRVMMFALQNGLKKKTDMAKSLSIPVDAAARLQRELLEDGFVMATSKSHKPGFAKTGQPHFVPIAQGPAYQVMIEQLFDPLMMIDENYTTVDSTATLHVIAKQLQQLRSDSMPPPATPASSLRGRGTPTTASGLDPRASMTPYVTPSRPPITKRSREEDDIFSTSAKRPATGTPLYGRLKSVQSKYMLKAYGVSSSPVVRSE